MPSSNASSASSGIVKVGEVTSELSSGGDKETVVITKPDSTASKANASAKKSVVQGKEKGKVANATAEKKDVKEAHKVPDLGFFQVMYIWQGELLRCIPVMMLAWGALEMAVHYPKMVDQMSHWKMVRITTKQTDFAMGGMVKAHGSKAYSTFSL